MTTFNNITSSGIVQPGDTVVARIQHRRGYKINLPQPLSPGELGWCIDSKQLYIGLDDVTSSSIIDVKTQLDVQFLIDNNIIEFTSKWSNLNVTANVSGEPIEDSEEKLVNDLDRMTTNDFLQDSYLIGDIESKVGVLSHFKNTIETAFNTHAPSLLNSYNQIITVERTNIVPARILVTTDGSGVVTSVAVTGLDEDTGLGYYLNQNINIPNPNGVGVPAVVKVQTLVNDEDGQGRIATISLVSAGTGYPINLVSQKFTLPTTDYNTFTATATTALHGSAIVPLLTTVVYTGMFYRTKPRVIVSGGSPTSPAIVEVDTWNPATGEILTLNVIYAGAGYVSAPTITIAPPLTTEFYRFKYHIGVMGITAPDFANIMADINSETDDYYPSSDLVNPDFIAQLVGTSGYGYTVVVDANGDASLTLDTPNQASSLAAMINALAPQNPPLALTTQNVEILTSYSEMPTPPTTVIYPSNKLFSGTLTSTPTWQQVMVVDPELLGPPTALVFDQSISDVQHLQISVKDGLGTFIMAGNMTVVSATFDCDLSLDSTEVKHASLSAYNVYFRSQTSLGYTFIEYKHDFPSNLYLKFTSAQWLS